MRKVEWFDSEYNDQTRMIEKVGYARNGWFHDLYVSVSNEPYGLIENTLGEIVLVSVEFFTFISQPNEETENEQH